MAKLRAAVLAAGRGVRMGGGKPKSLLPVRGADPLMRFILLALKDAGVDDLVVVTGHRPKDIEEFVDEEWNGNVQYVWNPRYASWGNFHSVRVALDQSPGSSVLVVNCDIVIHPDVISRTLATPGDLVLAVERRKNLDMEDMRVQLDRGHVKAIGKDLKLARSHGEYAGVSLIRPTASAIYQRISTELEWAGETGLYYEDVYGRMIGSVEIRSSRVDEGEYAEVDTPADEENALRVANQHYPHRPEPVDAS